MSLLISCDNLEKNIGNRELFDSLNFRVHERERIGLIGPNGAGKSTLLKILAGMIHAEGGDITLRKNLRLVYMPQVEKFNPEHTVLEAALDALADDVGDSHQKEASVMIMLGKLGFDDVSVKVGGLSGGWQKRLSIARQIARDPDVLLLDEPTNHLDVDGIEWLEGYLKTAPFAYIMISHDRRLLDGATNRIIELNPMFDGGNLSYDCPYNEFMRRRADFMETERTRLESLSNKNRREQEWVKAGVKARGTKQRSRLQAAEELQQTVQTLKRQTATPQKVLLEFESTERKTKRLIVLHGVCKSYGDKLITEKLDLTLTPGKRIGLLGNNGAGKSTLMRLIAGEEKPDSGGVTTANGCRIVHFKQDRQFLDEKQSLREALSVTGSDMVSYQGEVLHINAWASRLRFRSDQMDTPVGSLSGGERARVIMGRLMQQDADVLLLDEPTNDLDIGSIEVLEESLKTFPGALVLVTHDREMLDRVCNHLLALDGKGGMIAYASYGQWKDAQKPVVETAKAAAKTASVTQTKPTKLSYKEQREWDSMEDNIMLAEQKLEDLQANPVNAVDANAFTTYCQHLSEAQLAVDTLYARWAELEARVKGS